MKRWLPRLLRPLARLVTAASEQQGLAIFDGLADPAFLFDATTHRFLHANPAAQDLLGYTLDELRTMIPLDLHPPEDRDAVRRRLDDTSDRGAHYYQIVTKGGDLLPVEVHSSLIRYNGRSAYLSVMRDVSDREEHRRQMEDLARLAAEAPTPILRLASNGAVLYANQAARALLTQNEEGLLCAPRQWGSWVRDALRADQPMQTEAIVGERTCLLTFVPVVARCYVNVYSLDITDRLQAHEQLRQERDLAEGLINTAPAIVLLLTPEGCVVRANAYTERLLGHSAEDLVGCDWFATLVPEPDREPARQALQRAVAGESVAGHRNRVYTADGATRLIEWYTATLYDAEGVVSGVLGIGHDITERQQLETRLRLSQKMEAVGQLAGGIAHDFNNLLQVINGNAEFALMEPSLPDQCRDDIQEIHRAGHRAAELTAQLLAYSRQQAVQLVPVDLNQLLKQMRAALARTLGKRIDIAMELNPTSQYAMADEIQLEQAILNLAFNARDAMPEGGQLTFATSAAELDEQEANLLGIQPGPYAVIRVSDTGLGMDEVTIEHAFEPFFTTKEVGKGTGLGLAQVYGILNQCGGAVSVESAPNQGTTFRLYLPVAEKAPTPREKPSEEAPLGAGETILIAEDDAGVRRLATRLLTRLGYRTLEAAGVVEALAVTQRYRGNIHLLLTDVIMPDGTGIECARQIRAVRPGIAVLYMSGYAEDAVRIADTPPDSGILPKPFTLPQIAAAVAQALEATPLTDQEVHAE